MRLKVFLPVIILLVLISGGVMIWRLTALSSSHGITKEMDDAMPKAYKVSILAPGDRDATPGTSGAYTLTLVNGGLRRDTYTISATSKLGWADLSQVPASVTLAPKEDRAFSIAVSVPPTARVGQVEVITVDAHSPHVSDGNITEITVVEQLP